MIGCFNWHVQGRAGFRSGWIWRDPLLLSGHSLFQPLGALDPGLVPPVGGLSPRCGRGLLSAPASPPGLGQPPAKGACSQDLHVKSQKWALICHTWVELWPSQPHLNLVDRAQEKSILEEAGSVTWGKVVMTGRYHLTWMTCSEGCLDECMCVCVHAFVHVCRGRHPAQPLTPN